MDICSCSRGHGVRHAEGRRCSIKQDQSRDQANRNDNANNLMYQQGLNHGQADRANNQAHQYRLQPNNADDRRAYESGYDQGYQNSRDADHDYRGQNAHYGAPNDNRQPGTAFRMVPMTACRIDRQGTALVRRSIITIGDRGYSGYSSSFWASWRRSSAIAQPRTSTRRRTVRPTFRDMKRAITARAPTTGNPAQSTADSCRIEMCSGPQDEPSELEATRRCPTHSVFSPTSIAAHGTAEALSFHTQSAFS